MPTIEQIKQPIAQHLTDFQSKFRSSMQSSVPLLNLITRFLLRRKGKQMRPLFVFFAAQACGGINETTHRAAALIELLHTATLVHDDIVDDSLLRRSFFSVKALWKNKIAVLVGDYLLAQGLLLAVENKDFGLLEIVSKAVQQMSEGELLQIQQNRFKTLSEKDYFAIIEKKTAALIAACAAAGAASAKAEPELVNKMHLFGLKIGIAFQIKDDLFDIGPEDIGKPLALDIKSGKITLPLIYALNNASLWQKSRILWLLQTHGKSKPKVKEIIEFIHEHNGVKKAQACMAQYHKEALALLQDLPDSAAKSSLQDLANYTCNREK